MVIVAGSVPGCKPLWDRLLKGKPIALDSSGSQTVHTSFGHSRNSSVVGKVRLILSSKPSKNGSSSDDSIMLADRHNPSNEVFVHRSFQVEKSRASSGNRKSSGDHLEDDLHGVDLEWQAGMGPAHRIAELPASNSSLHN